MRSIVVLIYLALIMPVLASDSGEPEPSSKAPTWIGQHSDQLIASWGEPKKSKRHGKDGKVLVYRLRYFGEQIVGDTNASWSDVGIGPTPVFVDGAHEPIAFSGPPLTHPGGQEVIATQKVRFFVDRQGIIQRAEFAPRKWKNKP